MRILTLLVALSFLTFGLKAKEYTKASASSITFKIKNAGLNVDGKFKSVSTTGTFDPSNTSNINLTGTAYVKSVFTDNSLRDRHISEKSEFFNLSKTPTVTMESYKVEKVSEGKYTVYWKLTMRGVSKNIKTTMTATKSGSGYKLYSSFKIDRNTWGLGGSGLKAITMGDIVTVTISTIMN